jgi:hypothetical protein
MPRLEFVPERDGFHIGRALSRRSLGGSQSRRLQLWINDNTPGNGSGQFRCHVQVWR